MNLNLEQKKINALYVNCGGLREASLKIDKTIKMIEGISVNASIVAGQTGGQAKVFSEIASQIKKTSLKMKYEINMLLERITLMTVKSLRNVILLTRMEKLRESLTCVCQNGNYDIVQSAYNRIVEQMMSINSGLSLEANSFYNSLKNFEELLNRLFISLTAIRVEANMFEDQFENNHSLESLISSLEKLISSLSSQYEGLRERTVHFKYNTNVCTNFKEQSEKRNIA